MRKGHVEGRIKELEAPYSTDPGAEPNLESAIRVVGQALDRVKERPIPPILVVSPDQVAQVMKDMGADARQYVPVPYMEQKVAAGLPLEIADDRVKDYLLVHRRVARRPETLFGVQVQGDSMDPRYPSGSIVVVDRSQSDPAALIHRVILAVLDDSAAVKILNQDASHWILESQNPKYRPMYVDRAENPVIGRVIGGWVEEG
jgi:SOS-response transcriptional repressor LexA